MSNDRSKEMEHFHILSLFSFIILIFTVSDALNCSNPPKVIDVNQSGEGGSFKTIQGAIESVPKPNTQWTHIRIAPGTYTEKVIISYNRPCIFLEGAGSSSTIIQWSDHDRMASSATFESSASDVVAKGIAFENIYNVPYRPDKGILPALAAKLQGDKNAFYNCSFIGVQDTLWDNRGRHYFRNCYIQGGTDFIFGDGQSIYEESVINFTMGADGPKVDGVITAQKRMSMDSPTGFVFKKCNITGVGAKAELGRAYGPFSRVIIAYSYLADVVRPEGWAAWNYTGHEANFTYVEEHNYGQGAHKSKRVSWIKDMDSIELNKFLNISYIDNEGWIVKQPISC